MSGRAATDAAGIAAQRARVVEEALSWVGTPYHHAARIKGAGVDCGMILAAVYHDAGVTGPIVPAPYPPDWHLHRRDERYLRELEAYAPHVVELDALEPGDIPVYRFGYTFSHGAIYVGGGRIVHAYLDRGCEITTLDDAELQGRAVTCRSPWGPIDGR